MRSLTATAVTLIAVLGLASSASAKHGNPPPSSSPPPPTTSAPAALSTVTVNPSSVVGGTPSTGTVRLTAAAPSGGFIVPLTSDDPAAAAVPASVTVPAGATTANFPITTFVVPNPQSSLIIGGEGLAAKYGILTVYTASAFNSGSISIIPGNGGSGTVTSQPAGINCVITRGNGAGACTASFTPGTVVRLDARPASDSSFVGWRGLPGCSDPSKITVARATNINCQPGFNLR